MSSYRQASFYLSIIVLVLFAFQRIAPINFSELFNLRQSIFTNFEFWKILTYWLPFSGQGFESVISFIIIEFVFIKVSPSLEELWGTKAFLFYCLTVIISNFIVITLLGNYPYYGSYLDLMLLWACGFGIPIQSVKLFWLIRVQIKLLASIYFVAILIKIVYFTMFFEYSYLLVKPLSEEDKLIYFVTNLLILLSSFLSVLFFSHKIYGKNKNPLLKLFKKDK